MRHQKKVRKWKIKFIFILVQFSEMSGTGWGKVYETLCIKRLNPSSVATITKTFRFIFFTSRDLFLIRTLIAKNPIKSFSGKKKLVQNFSPLICNISKYFIKAHNLLIISSWWQIMLEYIVNHLWPGVSFHTRWFLISISIHYTIRNSNKKTRRSPDIDCAWDY